MSSILRYAVPYKSSDPNLYRALMEMDSQLNILQGRIGGASGNFVDTPSAAAQPVAPPLAADFSVIGLDGKFLISIVNPQDANALSPTVMQLQVAQGMNAIGTPLLHNLQSATNINFDNSSSLVDYGVSSQLAYEFQDPNVTRFWRLRSSYDGQTWNDWQIFQSVAQCGPVGVWSQLLRTVATALLNSQAMTTDGTNALTQSGTSTQINVAAKSWNVGTQVIAYNGGSVNPGVYGTFYIYGLDPEKAGGAITFLSTQNLGVLTAQDGIIVFGFITTSGGGGGTGGGGGSCHIAGTMIEMFDGSFKDCALIVAGDEIKGTDGGKEIAQANAEAVPNVPCFTLVFDNGITVHGVSTSEPIMLASGWFLKVFDAIVGMQFQTRSAIAVLVSKTLLGNRTVYRQRLDRTKTFWADALASHNLKPI